MRMSISVLLVTERSAARSCSLYPMSSQYSQFQPAQHYFAPELGDCLVWLKFVSSQLGLRKL